MKELLARVIVEILGSPEKHVAETMQEILKRMKENKKFTIIKHELFPPEKVKDQPFWSTFVEAEVRFKDMDALTGFCFDFMPSSVEVFEPEKIDLSFDDLNNFMNDLIARLHQYDMVLKNIHAENILLKREKEKAQKKE